MGSGGHESVRCLGARPEEERKMCHEEKGQRGWVDRTEEEIAQMAVNDVPSFRLEVSSPAEVDELFKALGECDRLAAES